MQITIRSPPDHHQNRECQQDRARLHARGLAIPAGDLGSASPCAGVAAVRDGCKPFISFASVLVCLITTKVHSESFQRMYPWSFKNPPTFSRESFRLCLGCVFPSFYRLMLRWFLGIIFYKLLFFFFKLRYMPIQNLTFCTEYIKYILRKKKYSMSSVRNKRWNYCISCIFQNGDIFEKSSGVGWLRETLLRDWTSVEHRVGKWRAKCSAPSWQAWTMSSRVADEDGSRPGVVGAGTFHSLRAAAALFCFPKQKNQLCCLKNIRNVRDKKLSRES